MLGRYRFGSNYQEEQAVVPVPLDVFGNLSGRRGERADRRVVRRWRRQRRCLPRAVLRAERSALLKVESRRRLCE
eukprot:7385448-Prymnesium_polylepis.2